MKLRTLAILIAFSFIGVAAEAQPAYTLSMTSAGSVVGNSLGHATLTLNATCPGGVDTAPALVRGDSLDTARLDQIDIFTPLAGFTRRYDVPCGGSMTIGVVALEEVASATPRPLNGCVTTIYFGCLSPTTANLTVEPAAYSASFTPASVNPGESSTLRLIRTPRLRLQNGFTLDVSKCGTSAPGINVIMVAAATSWGITADVAAAASPTYTMYSCVTRAAVASATLQILGTPPPQQSFHVVLLTVPPSPGQCALGTTLCVAPSNDTQNDSFANKCTQRHTMQSLPIALGCRDDATGATSSCSLQVGFSVRNLTGAHAHSEPGRPDGEFSALGGTSSGNAPFTTTYTAPEVAGVVDVVVTGEQGTSSVAPLNFTIGVEVPGITQLPATGTGYSIRTSVGHGSSNRGATAGMATALKNIPAVFAQLLSKAAPTETPVTLDFTSLSLTNGGTFDVDTGDGQIDHPWHPPHCGHRTGVEADLAIRNIPQSQRRTLAAAIQQHFDFPVKGERPTDPTANHWHLKAR